VKASSYAYITFRFADVLAAGFPCATYGGTSPDNNRPALVTKKILAHIRLSAKSKGA
jgi:hypothetical protein